MRLVRVDFVLIDLLTLVDLALIWLNKHKTVVLVPVGAGIERSKTKGGIERSAESKLNKKIEKLKNNQAGYNQAFICQCPLAKGNAHWRFMGL